jgi:uncharacterized membrane protein
MAVVAVCSILDAPGFRDGRGRARWALALLYVAFGGFHLAAADSFLPIVPPQIPFPREVVLFTGLCEVAGGAGLILPATRRWAGALLGLYAVCVFPANLYHAFAHVSVPGLPSSWWYHAPRLAFQPVFVWWALYAGEVLDWPFSPHRPPFADKVIGAAGEA